MENKNKKNKNVILALIIIILLLVFSIGMYFVNNRDVINTSGIKLYYRVYTSDGWSKWYKNGQVAGKENKSITAIEAKIETDKEGHILYNTYSATNDFEDNDSYDGETGGDKKEGIYGIKFFLSDEVFKNYKIYYRSHNKKDGWMDYATDYNISGDNEVEIDKIQLKILLKDSAFSESLEKPNIGF